ncbi:hypothetical protein Tco_1003903 [Tanacetum coccineum]|uniref:Uncharacterized protein n=1 Tax=Tanacetum coccineum TaxID=301880 RepID=A0ABQ5FAN4_9ASTR
MLFDVIKAEVVLQEDQQDFLADRLEEMDSDYCDDEATACAIFMASLSPAGSINGDITGPSSDSELISEADYMVIIENDVAQYVPPPE